MRGGAPVTKGGDRWKMVVTVEEEKDDKRGVVVVCKNGEKCDKEIKMEEMCERGGVDEKSKEEDLVNCN